MNNMIKTFILMAGLTALFMAVGQMIGGNSGATFALIMAFAMNFFAYWFSDKMALSMSGAVEVDVRQAPELHRIVEDLSIRAGLPKPRVYMIPSDTPNAFATGRNPAHAAIAATAGLLRILDRNELEGVIAHELAHIKNRDILISSIAAVFAGAISHLATMAQWGLMFGGFGRNDDDEGGGGGLIGSILMMILAPLAAMVIQMAISRSREYLADATGSSISGRPRSLASALQRLQEYNTRMPMNVNPATAQMYIINPLTASSMMQLFSTHPPLEERIRRLMAMG